jgi:hypothetical protein
MLPSNHIAFLGTEQGEPSQREVSEIGFAETAMAQGFQIDDAGLASRVALRGLAQTACAAVGCARSDDDAIEGTIRRWVRPPDEYCRTATRNGEAAECWLSVAGTAEM